MVSTYINNTDTISCRMSNSFSTYGTRTGTIWPVWSCYARSLVYPVTAIVIWFSSYDSRPYFPQGQSITCCNSLKDWKLVGFPKANMYWYPVKNERTVLYYVGSEYLGCLRMISLMTYMNQITCSPLAFQMELIWVVSIEISDHRLVLFLYSHHRVELIRTYNIYVCTCNI